MPFKLPIGKAILIKGSLTVILITLSKMKQSLCTIDNTEARHQQKGLNMIFFEILAKMVNFAKDENENFKSQIYDWKRFIFDSLKRGRKPFLIILSGLRHRTEPIINTGQKDIYKHF